MDIAEIAKALKESDQNLAACLLDTLSILQDHEMRLQSLENPDLKTQLRQLRMRIDALDDARKFNALAALDQVCDLLGFKDLEAP